MCAKKLTQKELEKIIRDDFMSRPSNIIIEGNAKFIEEVCKEIKRQHIKRYGEK